MPELPEVEVLRRSLEPRLVGRRVERVGVSNPALRERVSRADLERRLNGRRIISMRRRAKYLLADASGDVTLVVHLGMSGRLSLLPADAPRHRHEHVSIYVDRGERLAFRDPRRFGLLMALPTASLETDRHFRDLGVEPLGEELSGARLRTLANRRRGPVKGFVMNANLVVGVGNIYASEALFQAGVHPRRSVARIAPARWDTLASAIRDVLGSGYRGGRHDAQRLSRHQWSRGLLQGLIGGLRTGGRTLQAVRAVDSAHRAGGSQHLLLSGLPEVGCVTEAVLIDMGGVILDMRSSNGVPSGQLDHRGRQALLRRLGGGLEAQDLERIVFEPWRLEYRQRYRRGREADLAPYLSELRRRGGSRLSDMELLEVWFAPYGESLRAMPGAVDAVEALRQRGLKVAVVSNVPLPGELYRVVLEREGFDGLVNTFRFSYDSGHRKPSPFMLRSALGELGVTRAAAVMVGDRQQSDVAAGRAAGVGTIWIRSEHAQGPAPDWTLPSISLLPELIERIGPSG